MLKEIKGCFATSLAGHDKGQMYIITEADDKYVYVCDGKNKLIDTPKKKKRKHIQLINRKDAEVESKLMSGTLINEDIKRAIKLIKAES
ncbi:MAG: KOW domain-containing RNA-binding protein [Lachnospira sp.]|nr:KOW domain-containing RNA-binding protein [Lachnospira sp.]